MGRRAGGLAGAHVGRFPHQENIGGEQVVRQGKLLARDSAIPCLGGSDPDSQNPDSRAPTHPHPSARGATRARVKSGLARFNEVACRPVESIFLQAFRSCSSGVWLI